MKVKREYALYHGDEFVDIGTKEYFAEKLGKPLKYMHKLSCKSYKERAGYNAYTLTLLKDDEEDGTDKGIEEVENDKNSDSVKVCFKKE